MFYFAPVKQVSPRCCATRTGPSSLRRQWTQSSRGRVVLCIARFASISSHPPKPTKRPPPTSRRKSGSVAQKRQIDASRKASLLLNCLTKVSKKSPEEVQKVLAARKTILPAALAIPKNSNSIQVDNVEQATVEIDEKEEAIQQRITKNRNKLVWPGFWTVFAVAGTYGAFAYLDAKYSSETTTHSVQVPERFQLPQSWFLTPTVVKEGLKKGWNELDRLTIGVVVVSVAIHFMKRSPLPFWEHLIHISGEKKYTAFTYPFVHSHWGHIGQNMFALCWFLPGVVRYFEGDLFHTAAFFVSVPLITSYVQHFAFRWGTVKGLPLNMGSSGAVAAVFGAFCMAYPDEKVWTPSLVIIRLDGKYWGALFAFWQLAAMVKTPKGGNRPAFIVHLVSLGLGAAYIYFDGKGTIWKPLLAQLSTDQPVATPQ